MANLVILRDIDQKVSRRVLLAPLGRIDLDRFPDQEVVFSARTEWGGADNPLLHTLPPMIDIDLRKEAELSMLVELIAAESEAKRCGVNGAVNRLAEVLIIRMLRRQIEMGQSAIGLLGGLAHPRLSKAIVAIHEQPGRSWSNDDMAEVAGLSISRFIELFRQRVGETPQSYLRRWRMILARQDIQRGDRIQQVAMRYGYGSSEALGRAFHKQFGHSPVHARSPA